MYVEIWVLLLVGLYIFYYIYKMNKGGMRQIEGLKEPIRIWEELSEDTDFRIEDVCLSLNEEVYVKIFKEVETQPDIPEPFRHLKISVFLTRGTSLIHLHHDLLGMETMRNRKIESVEDLEELEIDAILHASKLVRTRINTPTR